MRNAARTDATRRGAASRWLVSVTGVAIGLFAYRATLAGHDEDRKPAGPRASQQTAKAEATPPIPRAAARTTPEPASALESPVAEIAEPVAAAEPEVPAAKEERYTLDTVPPHLEPWRYEPLPMATPEYVFEEKYGGFDIEQLIDAARHLEDQFSGGCWDAFRARHASGQSFWRDWDMGQDKDGDGRIDADAEFGISGTTDGVLIATGTDRLAGELKPYVVWLPVDQYPELYTLRDERSWVKSEISRLRFGERHGSLPLLPPQHVQPEADGE